MWLIGLKIIYHETLRRFRNNTLLHSAGASFLVNISFAGLTFLSGFVLARVLGTLGLGAYEYADTWIEILLIVAVLGFDTLLVYKIPVYEHTGNWSEMHGIWRFAQLSCLLVTLGLMLVFLGFFIFQFWTPGSLNWSINTLSQINLDSQNGRLLWASIVALLLLPLRVYLRLVQGALQGFRQVVRGLLPDYVVRLLIFLLSLIVVSVFWNGFLPPWLAMGLHIIGSLIAVVYGWTAVRRYMPQMMYEAIPEMKRREWLASNAALVVSSAAALINLRLGILLLGMMTTLQEVSYYGVALRLAAVIVIAQTAMNVTIQPHISRLNAQNDIWGLQKLVTSSVRTVMLVSVPISLGLIIFGKTALRIFGADFVDAYPILIILAVSQLLNTLSGPAGNLLFMTNHEKDVAYTHLSLVIVNALLSWFLIPSYGALGAALAAGIGILLRSLILAGIVYYHFGIITLPIVLPRKTR